MSNTTHQPEPVVIVIFGITGDLARRKVLPALYHLFANNMIDPATRIIGTSRRDVPVAEIIGSLRSTIDYLNDSALAVLEQQLEILQLEPTEQTGFQTLQQRLVELEAADGRCLHRLFYLSIPPDVYPAVIANLGEAGLHQSCDHGQAQSRVLVEKPFGHDTASAESLIAETARYFSPEQVFRIDHYLAKETAQNILTFRARNPLFHSIWNNKYITKVSITAAESIGIEGRRDFYDNVGALRDLIQSHLMQLLSLTIMKLPDAFNADAIHAAKLQVLETLQPLPADLIAKRAVRGQYASYRDEIGADSNTETYASIVLYSDDPAWEGVPLRLTTGKALKAKRTSITVDFGSGDVNRLQFRLQPDEGIIMTMQVKKPGLGTEVEQTDMRFHYHSAFEDERAPDAYERVLVDALRGDHLLFATDDEVMASWRALQPLLNAWQGNDNDLKIYENGSDGPDTTVLEVRRSDH